MVVAIAADQQNHSRVRTVSLQTVDNGIVTIAAVHMSPFAVAGVVDIVVARVAIKYWIRTDIFNAIIAVAAVDYNGAGIFSNGLAVSIGNGVVAAESAYRAVVSNSRFILNIINIIVALSAVDLAWSTASYSSSHKNHFLKSLFTRRDECISLRRVEKFFHIANEAIAAYKFDIHTIALQKVSLYSTLLPVILILIVQRSQLLEWTSQSLQILLMFIIEHRGLFF